MTNATEELLKRTSAALTAALDRTDAAEARGYARGLREAAKRYRDGGDWDVFATADCAILDLITEGAQEDI